MLGTIEQPVIVGFFQSRLFMRRRRAPQAGQSLGELAAQWQVYVPLTLLAVTHTWTNSRQPAPYMDELFHVPQAQQICSLFPAQLSSLEYSRSITTPPGPYLLPALLSIISPFFCSTQGLRLISALLVAVSIPLLAVILRRLKARQPHCTQLACLKSVENPLDAPLTVGACLLVLHPVLFFYGNLFYTDPPAIFFLLACFKLSLEGRPVSSALCGVLSASCRQTSVVLHAYIVFDELLDLSLRGESLRNAMTTASPHAGAGLLYLYFFRWNSFQVALGDHAHHPVSLHPAMISYYAGYLILFGAPLMFATGSVTAKRFASFAGFVIRISRDRQWQVWTWLVCFVLLLCVGVTGDYAHPFALSDNRHYVFYIYRRLLLRNGYFRYMGIPLYTLALLGPFVQIVRLLDASEEGIAKESPELGELLPTPRSWAKVELLSEASLVLAIAICTVPSTLLELRYFVPGFLLSSLRSLSRRTFSRWQGNTTLVLVAAVNIILVYVFCELPFPRAIDAHMPNDISPGRFLF